MGRISQLGGAIGWYSLMGIVAIVTLVALPIMLPLAVIGWVFTRWHKELRNNYNDYPPREDSMTRCDP